VQNTIIAGEFTLHAETLLDPEQYGIERKENKGDLLEEIGPVVAAAEMLHLMEDDLFQLLGGELCQKVGGNKDPRMEESDDAGTIEMGGAA
jgi:hypothetical protein